MSVIRAKWVTQHAPCNTFHRIEPQSLLFEEVSVILARGDSASESRPQAGIEEQVLNASPSSLHDICGFVRSLRLRRYVSNKKD